MQHANAWTASDLNRPLTEKGDQQAAAAAADWAAAYPLVMAVSSEAVRASATLEVLAPAEVGSIKVLPVSAPPPTSTNAQTHAHTPAQPACHCASLPPQALHPSKSNAPLCEKMFDTMGYGPLNKFWANAEKLVRSPMRSRRRRRRRRNLRHRRCRRCRRRRRHRLRLPVQRRCGLLLTGRRFAEQAADGETDPIDGEAVFSAYAADCLCGGGGGGRPVSLLSLLEAAAKAGLPNGNTVMITGHAVFLNAVVSAAVICLLLSCLLLACGALRALARSLPTPHHLPIANSSAQPATALCRPRAPGRKRGARSEQEFERSGQGAEPRGSARRQALGIAKALGASAAQVEQLCGLELGEAEGIELSRGPSGLATVTHRKC